MFTGKAVFEHTGARASCACEGISAHGACVITETRSVSWEPWAGLVGVGSLGTQGAGASACTGCDALLLTGYVSQGEFLISLSLRVFI